MGGEKVDWTDTTTTRRRSEFNPNPPTLPTPKPTTLNINGDHDDMLSLLGVSLSPPIVMDPVKEHDADAHLDLTNDSEGPHDSHIPSMFTHLGLPAPL